MKKETLISCAGCNAASCYIGEGCQRGQDLEKYDRPARDAYYDTQNKRILEVSTCIEAEHYMQWTRLEEIIGFARQMQYTRIGIAHCIGLTNETKKLKDILDQHFEVAAICCKFSGINKKDFNLSQINEQRYEAICSPIGQAMALNDLETDLNIIVGLCVGHDILFTKYSQAPVTTFIVKDRVTGHNPAVAIYSNYYLKMLKVK